MDCRACEKNRYDGRGMECAKMGKWRNGGEWGGGSRLWKGVTGGGWIEKQREVAGSISHIYMAVGRGANV